MEFLVVHLPNHLRSLPRPRHKDMLSGLISKHYDCIQRLPGRHVEDD